MSYISDKNFHPEQQHSILISINLIYDLSELKKVSVNLFIIDDLIRKGHILAAQREIKHLANRRIPIENQAKLASYARRTNLPLLALRILHARVRSPRQLSRPLSVEERGEYATNLALVGATTEAELLLDSETQKSALPILYAHTTLLFGKWDYPSAIPYLEKFVKRATKYDRAIGKVNLVAAYMGALENRKASALLSETLELTKKHQYRLLYGNCLELSAQLAIKEGNYSKASNDLKMAECILCDKLLLDSFFVTKWKTFMECSQLCDPKEIESKITHLRYKAAKIAHWETVRDCDRFLAIRCKNNKLMQHLYFGTPHSGFRKRLLEEYRGTLDIPDTYLLQFGDSSNKTLDLEAGTLIPGSEKLTKAGHRLLRAMCSDFYRPSPIANLHAQVYPGEYFNPVSSQNRVHQNISRLRKWLRDHGIEFDIQKTDGGYGLTSDSYCNVRIPKTRDVSVKEEFQLSQLQNRWPSSAFSLKEVNGVLGISSSSSQRLLNFGLEKGRITRIGKRRGAKYQFV